MGKEYDIYCEFDIAEHKKKYTNYLEVLIEPSGKIGLREAWKNPR